MRELLAKKSSRVNSYQVVALVANNPERFKELVEIIVSNESPYSEKASWAMNHCYEEGTDFFDNYYKELTAILPDDTYSDSVKRNIVRILQFKEIPEKYQASVIDCCFYLVNKKIKPKIKLLSKNPQRICYMLQIKNLSGFKMEKYSTV